MSDLPEKGWAGYGSPQHPLTPRGGISYRRTPDSRRDPLCACPNLVNRLAFERHAALAEARLEREGVLVELVAYVAGIGRARGR